MRIIVEGADGTGKTTLVKHLAERYNCDIINMTKWGSKVFGEYKKKLILNDIVSDRSFLSEIVYKQAFELQPNISFGEFDWLIHNAKRNDWKFIILTGPIKLLKQRLIDRGDECPEVIANLTIIIKIPIFTLIVIKMYVS